MTARRLSLSSLLAILCSSVGLWVSRGALGLSGTDLAAARIGVLPSFWWLAAIALCGCVIWFAATPSPRRVGVLWLSVLVILPWLPLLPRPVLPAVLVFAGRLRVY